MTEHVSGGHPPDCARCEDEAIERGEWGIFMRRMIVCPTCGNKRCPKATDHRLNCTGSNEPGQPGSRYGELDGRPISGDPDAALMRVALADWQQFINELAVLLREYDVELDGDGTEQTVCIDRIREALERASEGQLDVSADQPITGESCPTCGKVGADTATLDHDSGRLEADCGDEWHDRQVDVSAVSGTAAPVDGDLVARLRRWRNVASAVDAHEAAADLERLRAAIRGLLRTGTGLSDYQALERLRAAIRGLLRTGTGLSDYQAAAKRAREVLGDE